MQTYVYGMAETPDVIFVREYVKTGDALLAFNRAGYTTGGVGAKVAAERTLARPEIKLALSVLADMGIENKEDIPIDPQSREGLVERLDFIHDAAVSDGAYPSAINAIKTQAQLLGYMDQVVTVNHNVSARDLSLEDLRMLVSRELGDTPALIEGIIEGDYTDV